MPKIQDAVHVFKKPFFKEFSWYGLSQISTQVFAFLGVMFTARYLGPINTGLSSFVQNYLSVFVSLSSSIDFYFTWRIAKSENMLFELRRTIGYKFYTLSVLTVLGIVSSFSLLPRDVAMLSLALFLPLVFGSVSGFYTYTTVQNKARLLFFAHFAVAVSFFVGKLLLIHYKAPLFAFVLLNSIEGVTITILLAFYFLAIKKLYHDFFDGIWPSFLQTVSFLYSIKTTVLLIFSWQLVIRIDQLILAPLSNAYSLGVYSAATKIAEMPNMIAGVLYTALISRIALYEKNASEEDFTKNYKKIAYLYLIIGSFCALMLIIFAPVAVHIIYGAKFADSVSVLQAYAFSIPAAFVLTHSFSFYGAKEKPGRQVIIFMVGIVTNSIGMIILYRLFGTVGAAYATAIAYSLMAFLFIKKPL